MQLFPDDKILFANHQVVSICALPPSTRVTSFATLEQSDYAILWTFSLQALGIHNRIRSIRILERSYVSYGSNTSGIFSVLGMQSLHLLEAPSDRLLPLTEKTHIELKHNMWPLGTLGKYRGVWSVQGEKRVVLFSDLSGRDALDGVARALDVETTYVLRELPYKDAGLAQHASDVDITFDEGSGRLCIKSRTGRWKTIIVWDFV
jgi:hypothetical protein